MSDTSVNEEDPSAVFSEDESHEGSAGFGFVPPQYGTDPVEKEKGSMSGAASAVTEKDDRVSSVGTQQEGAITGPKIVYVTEPKIGSDSSDADVTSSEEEDMRFEFISGANVPAEYWHIQKLIKYIKSGDQTATGAALGLLKDNDLSMEIHQLAIRDMVGGLEVLVNLLEVEYHSCKSGALKVLNEISTNARIRQDLVDLGIVPMLVDLLSAQALDLRILAALTMSKVGRVRRARRFFRKTGGIPKLMDLMDVSQEAMDNAREDLNEDGNEELDAVIAGASAASTLALSKKNREYFRRYGFVEQMVRCLQSVHYDIVIPILAALAEMAQEPKFQLAIESEEGIVEDLCSYLKEKDKDMVTNTARILFKAAESDNVCRMVREAGGLDHMMTLCNDKTALADMKLMAAVTGAVWKLATNKENVRRLDQLRTMDIFVSLLSRDDEVVLANSAGGIAELCKNPENCDMLRMAHGLPPLVNMLNGTYGPLLATACTALAKCARNADCMKEMEQLDAVRLIWSLLRHPEEQVQAEAAWALCPCIENGFDSGEMVRSFVGGLQMVVELLTSDDDKVLTAVCALITEIAKDTENLAVITDLGVVALLAALVDTDDERLQTHLAGAIGNCCAWGNNCHEFGRLGVIKNIEPYMYSDDGELKKTTAHAIHQLTTDPYNCIELHSRGVVPFLLRQIASTDLKTQNAAAGALSNMRKLVLTAEKFQFSQ